MKIDLEYLKILATVATAAAGWIAVHYFNSRRDKFLKRRDLRIEYLINVYRILTNEISHREGTKERGEKLENILSDIQLFGSKTQVVLAKELATEIAAGQFFELDPLINDLRNDLRKQLKLSKIEGNIKWLRFEDKKPSNAS